MNILKHHGDKIEMSGRSRLRAWVPGMLQALTDYGYNLKEAQRMAKLFGYLKDESTVRNKIVLTGQSLIRDLALNLAPVGLVYHSIGTGNTAPDPADIALTTETQRKVWTLAGAGDVNIASFSVYYAASECSVFIKEAGVWGGNASSTPDSGVLFSHYLQSKDNTASAYDLTFDYDLIFGVE